MLPQHFCSALGMALGIPLLPRGMILNGPYLSRENIDPEF